MSGGSSDEWVISICGLNCAKCDIYKAGHGNEELRDEIVEWFRKEHDEDIKPDQVGCEGCRGSLSVHWSPECRIILCARNREIEYCFQCTDFPCTILAEFSSDGISHHKRTIENLKRMKQNGIKAWIDEQRRKGQCVFCP
jgi:hypothetical protein